VKILEGRTCSLLQVPRGEGKKKKNNKKEKDLGVCIRKQLKRKPKIHDWKNLYF